ncbi:MAG: hypothetical protein IH621_11015, partial [Krumholzibacteria bacterium]|nr:hypothetical protein [Candidatus Krumholzibacteria bacterium]
ALALGRTARGALAGLLANPNRVLDLYVGTAAAAPVQGTLRITTLPPGAYSADTAN